VQVALAETVLVVVVGGRVIVTVEGRNPEIEVEVDREAGAEVEKLVV
jgi:hypothetical protein